MIGDLLSARPAETGFTLIAVSGRTLGTFDVIVDARAGRHVVVRQRGENKSTGRLGYNVWTEFLPRAAARATPAGKPTPVTRDFTLSNYRIQAEIAPQPGGLGVRAVTRVKVRVGANSMRSFPFEITRAMQISAAGVGALAFLGWRFRTPGARRALLGATLAFLAASWPLARRAYEFDPEVLPLVVPLSFLRALAQGTGLVLGAVRLAAGGRATVP